MSGENCDGQVHHDPLTHYGSLPGSPGSLGYDVGNYTSPGP